MSFFSFKAFYDSLKYTKSNKKTFYYVDWRCQIMHKAHSLQFLDSFKSVWGYCNILSYIMSEKVSSQKNIFPLVVFFGLNQGLAILHSLIFVIICYTERTKKLLKCRCIFFPNKVYLSLCISITALRKKHACLPILYILDFGAKSSFFWKLSNNKDGNVILYIDILLT